MLLEVFKLKLKIEDRSVFKTTVNLAIYAE